MKNWKKFAALGMAAVMAAGTLAGCRRYAGGRRGGKGQGGRRGGGCHDPGGSWGKA